MKKKVTKKAVKKVISGLKDVSSKLDSLKVNIDVKTTGPAPLPTVDSLLASVPVGWEALLRNDAEKAWFANVYKGEMSFSFYGKTAVSALSRAMDMAISFQAMRDAEMNDQRKPMAILCVTEDLLPIIQKAIDGIGK